jgi:hypothetical protein
MASRRPPAPPAPHEALQTPRIEDHEEEPGVVWRGGTLYVSNEVWDRWERERLADATKARAAADRALGADRKRNTARQANDELLDALLERMTSQDKRIAQLTDEVRELRESR